MEKLNLEVKERTKLGKKSKSLRLKGFIPGIIYGRGMESIPIEIEEKLFNRVLGGSSSRNVIISLKVGEKSLPVIAQEVQKDPMTDGILHVDFRKISMDEAIKTKIPMVILGEAVGVKLDGGILVHPLREIEVKCLPSDIPGKIELDISELKIGDAIHVSDLKPIKSVEFLTPAQEIIVTVSAPTKEEEIAPPAAVPGVEEAVVSPEGAAAPVPGAPAPAPGAAPAPGEKAAAGPAAKPGAPAGKPGAPAGKPGAPAGKPGAPAGKPEKSSK
jgi:large subunit ribosomal protein L25